MSFPRYLKYKDSGVSKDQMDALQLFRTDMATYQRVYTFLSQIFDYAK
jgi:type I restriction enzyme R subunit